MHRGGGPITAILLCLVALGGCAKESGIDLTLVADATLDRETLAVVRTLDLWALGQERSSCRSYALAQGFGARQGEERVRFRASPRSDRLGFHVFLIDETRDVRAYGSGTVDLRPDEVGTLRVTLKAVDAQKNLYASGGCSRVDTLREAAPDAGSPDAGSSLLLNNPTGLAADGTGSLYVADTGRHVIRRIAPVEGVVIEPRIVAGELDLPGSNDTSAAPALPARFNTPWGLAFDDSRQRLYVADRDNHTIRQVEVQNSFSVTTLAGSVGQSGSADGVGSAASFNAPVGLAYDGAQGRLFVADSQNHVVREIAVGTGLVTRLAGLPGTPGYADGPSGSAQFSTPAGLAYDGTRNVLYVADSGNRRVRQIALDGTNRGMVETLLPTSCEGDAESQDPLCFRNPDGLAYDRTNDVLYVTDADVAEDTTHALRRLDRATCPRCQVITVLGQRETVLVGGVVPLVLAPLGSPNGIVLLSPSRLAVTSGAAATSTIQIIQGLSVP